MKFHLFTFLILVLSCSSPENRKEIKHDDEFSPTKIEFAKGFSVTYGEGYKLVEVPKPFPGAEEGFKYLLIPRGAEVPAHEESVQVIEIPLEKIVCTSTTHIPLLDYLDETESLVGFPTTDYISSKKMRKRVDEGQVTELGVDDEMNLERILDLDPEAIIAYSMTGDLGQFRKISQAGIPVIMNAEYLEEHPLGRAEWIKFVALFYNKERMADSVFRSIKTRYIKLKQLGLKAKQRPEVYSGIVYGDTWFMPGGNNYAAKLLNDAGGNYLWSDNESRGFLEISFEAVYEKAHQADYWIGVGSFETLEAIKDADERYAYFKAFNAGNVFSYNARIGAKGGSEFLELGYLRPDLILADLIKIIHPKLLPEHELYFYFKLE